MIPDTDVRWSCALSRGSDARACAVSSVWRVAGWVVGGAGARCPAPGDTGWAGGPRVALEFGASACGGLRVRVRAAFGDG